MASKTIQISARIPSEDAEFLNELIVNGAKTPSDKLRAIIKQARQRHDNAQDYTGSYKMMQDLVLPVCERIRQYELEQKAHSAFIFRILEWLPDLAAFIVSALPQNGCEDDLKAYEQGVISRVFGLFESVMQMGVGRNPCYDSNCISRELESILALSRIIDTIEKKENNDEGNFN